MNVTEALRLPRVAICGGPHTGKTTLAASVQGKPVIHTDDLIGQVECLPAKERWAAVSSEAVRICSVMPSFCVEGIRVAHALRKGLRVDAVIWLETVWTKPCVPYTSKHASTARAVQTVFEEWLSTAQVPVIYG